MTEQPHGNPEFFTRMNQAAEDAAGSTKRTNGHDTNAAGGAPVEPPEDLCLTLRQWVEREIPPDDNLMGEWLSTTCRVLLVATTGLGKTNFAMAVGISIAMGKDFLNWRAGRPARVLYIDGEMSRSLFKRRIKDAMRRARATVDTTFFGFCRDDFPEMPPLNTEAGQRFIEALIERLGGIDLVIFDNIQSLLVGDMKDEEPWQETLPWIRQLTSRPIGQLWIHHTGHDESRSYGTKTREWQLDTVAVMDRDSQSAADIAFTLRFTKARQRTPENRADFADIRIALNSDQWTLGSEAAAAQGGERIPRQARLALNLLHDAIGKSGEVPADCGDHLPANVACVKVDLWHRYCDSGGLADSDDEEVKQAAFRRVRRQLNERGLIKIWNGWVCPIDREKGRHP